MDHVGAVLDEVLNETVGTSSKKWALVVVAHVVRGDGRTLARPPLDPPSRRLLRSTRHDLTVSR